MSDAEASRIYYDDRDLIRSLCDLEEGLSEWEVEFVDDIAQRMKADPGMTLTLKQRAKATEIANREGV